MLQANRQLKIHSCFSNSAWSVSDYWTDTKLCIVVCFNFSITVLSSRYFDVLKYRLSENLIRTSVSQLDSLAFLGVSGRCVFQCRISAFYLTLVHYYCRLLLARSPIYPQEVCLRCTYSWFLLKYWLTVLVFFVVARFDTRIRSVLGYWICQFKVVFDVPCGFDSKCRWLSTNVYVSRR